MSKAGDELTWMNVCVRVGLNACTHPIEYAKTLIQIGYEPLPPYKSRTFFGKDQLFYPSIFSYIRHIKRTDGLSGCYRGLTPKLSSNIVSGLVFQRVVNCFPVENEDKKSEDMTLEERTMLFLQKTGRESVARTAAIIASQPFHVIAIRTMAEFVGKDGLHTNMFTSIAVIYREEGIFGFFAGLIPRVICDLAALWASNTIIHVLNNFLIEDKDIQTYVTAAVKFLASAFFYPLQVVSHCMTVSGSGLAAGSPPYMPLYLNWTDCYSHLKSINSLKRGSTLIWRRYAGPTVLAGGEFAMPTPAMFAKMA